MAIEATGKTIDLAISAALKQLGTDRDMVTYEVLEMPKTGFLGFGSAPARVRVKRLDEPDEPPAAPKVKVPEPHTPKKAVPQKAKEPQPKSAKEPLPSKPAKKPAAKPAPKPVQKSVQKPVPGEAEAVQGGDPAEILRGILERMGITGAVIKEVNNERGLLLEVSGANMGRLIGRRGETLDAVQRIVSSAANKGATERRRIVIDAEKYRAKREGTLEVLARNSAEKAVRYNRDILLEPMGSYSRHVIHAALQDNPYVTTHSVGNEPHRRVVISLSGAKKTATPRRESL